MMGINDASSGRWAFSNSATGMEFSCNKSSESTGDGTDTTGISSITGVTGDVLSRGIGVEYVKWSGIGCSNGEEGFPFGKDTLFKAAWTGVHTAGEGGGGMPESIVIGRIYVDGSNDGIGRGPEALRAIMDRFGTSKGHTILRAAVVPIRGSDCPTG